MKAACLISGGMDSSTRADYAKKEGCGIYALHANYGRHTETKERACGFFHFRCEAFEDIGKNDPIPYEGV